METLTSGGRNWRKGMKMGRRARVEPAGPGPSAGGDGGPVAGDHPPPPALPEGVPLLGTEAVGVIGYGWHFRR